MSLVGGFRMGVSWSYNEILDMPEDERRAYLTRLIELHQATKG